MRLTKFDWIFDSPIDFEHKKYLLLSYISDIKSDINNNLLYPSISEVEYQLSNLNKWVYTRELHIKKELKGIDFKKMTLIYDEPEDSEDMNQINQIVNYSIKQLNAIYGSLRSAYLVIESTITPIHIGISPLYKKEGYVLFQRENKYSLYSWSNWIMPSLSFIKYYDCSILTTPEFIKSEISLNNDLSNPMMVYIDNKENYPIEGCLLEVFMKSFLPNI